MNLTYLQLKIENLTNHSRLHKYNEYFEKTLSKTISSQLNMLLCMSLLNFFFPETKMLIISTLVFVVLFTFGRSKNISLFVIYFLIVETINYHELRLLTMALLFGSNIGQRLFLLIYMISDLYDEGCN